MDFSFETKIQEVEIDGVKKYAPTYVIDGKPMLVSHQDQIVYCDTIEEAQEYLDEEED